MTRIPLWAILVWVVLAMILTPVAGLFAYSQARARTRELNDIAPLEEGVDVLRVGSFLIGLRKPEAPGVDDNQAPPEVLRSTLAVPTLTPDASPGTPDPVETTDSGTPMPSDSTTPVAPQYQPRSDPRQVTVLLLGIDQRQGEQGPFRTDTMILLSLNPAAKTGVILSIPRDLWVVYPAGLGEGKINSANVIGESRQYPGGGPAFARRAVEGLLGIPIDYTILVNFDAFLTLVDVIGDVEVCPPAPIDDPKYPDGSYGYKPIHFDAGCQNLNAGRLLEYARTRATSGGDVDRSARQREVIYALRRKLLSLGGAGALLGNAQTLWDAVRLNIRTDLSLQELIELALVAETVPAENIRDGAIDYSHVLLREVDGEEVMVPIVTDISALVAELFSAPAQ